MANFHRNETAGLQGTSEFRSLRDDLADLRAKAPAGVVDQTVIALPDKSEQGQNIHAMRLGKNPAMPILIAGCHHAREWISAETNRRLFTYIVEHKNDKGSAGLKKLLKKTNEDLVVYLAEGSTGAGIDLESRERVERTLRNMKERFGYCDKCTKEAVSLLLRRRYI